MMNNLPVECVSRIMTWYWEFQRPVAVERIAAFQTIFAPTWAAVMTEIRECTPEYSLIWASVNYPSPMRLFYPDCNPRLPGSVASATTYTIQRRIGLIQHC